MKAYISSIIEAPLEAVWEIVRDFGRSDYFDEIVSCSITPEGQGDKVGAIREVELKSGLKGKEKLLALSDIDHSACYMLFNDETLPFHNYVAEVKLLPVTEGDHCFIQWSSTFTCDPAQEADVRSFIVDGIYRKCIEGIRLICKDR